LPDLLPQTVRLVQAFLRLADMSEPKATAFTRIRCGARARARLRVA
jgi:hypothetical protein